MNTYPEHDKLQAVKRQASVVQGFIDWLLDETDYIICEWDDEYGAYFNALISKSRERLMAEYFDIDLRKLSEEKDQMLNDWREVQGL